MSESHSFLEGKVWDWPPSHINSYVSGLLDTMNLGSHLVSNVRELIREQCFTPHSVIPLNFHRTFSHIKWLLLNITLKNKEKKANFSLRLLSSWSTFLWSITACIFTKLPLISHIIWIYLHILSIIFCYTASAVIVYWQNLYNNIWVSPFMQYYCNYAKCPIVDGHLISCLF